MGVYVGAISPAGIRARVENADLIISLGMFLTDIEMGGSQPPEALRSRCISSVENRVNIGFHTYTNITLRDFVHYLLRADLKRQREKVTYYDNLSGPKKHRQQRILVADVLREINYFLAQRKRFMAVAESGDSLFGGIDIKVGNDGLYLAQGFYASMGFAVPGARCPNRYSAQAADFNRRWWLSDDWCRDRSCPALWSQSDHNPTKQWWLGNLSPNCQAPGSLGIAVVALCRASALVGWARLQSQNYCGASRRLGRGSCV
jgi:hypothetical protein